MRILSCLVALMLLAGCGAGGNDYDPGLVRNPAFERGTNGSLEAWTFVSHASTGSYRFDTEGDMVVIERIDHEPWGQVVQHFDAAELVGRTLTFSADLSSTFDPGPGRSVMFTGISARVDGYKAGKPKMLGPSILVSANSAPGLTPESEGWHRPSVTFTVPEGATDLQLAIRMGMDGVLKARRPSLVDVTPP